MRNRPPRGPRQCYICGFGQSGLLDTHHIIPRRFGGTDANVNLVDLCPTCHRAIESIYDAAFWERIPHVVAENEDLQPKGPAVNSSAEELFGGDEEAGEAIDAIGDVQRERDYEQLDVDDYRREEDGE